MANKLYLVYGASLHSDSFHCLRISSCVLVWAFIAVNLPLRTSFVASCFISSFICLEVTDVVTDFCL